MARFDILEREQQEKSEKRAELPALTEEELIHASNIAENYRKLIFSSEMTGEAAAARSADIQKEEEFSIPSAADRVRDYVPAPAPAKNHNLFADISYVDGTLLKGGQETTIDAIAAAPAPAVDTLLAPVAEPEVEAPVDEEDALPTRRTMESIRSRATAAVEEAVNAHAGFWASLSPKVKAAFISVAVAVFVIVALVFANVAILNSLDASVANKQEQLAELVERSEAIGEEIASIVNPENVDAWAAANGMFQS